MADEPDLSDIDDADLALLSTAEDNAQSKKAVQVWPGGPRVRPDDLAAFQDGACLRGCKSGWVRRPVKDRKSRRVQVVTVVCQCALERFVRLWGRANPGRDLPSIRPERNRRSDPVRGRDTPVRKFEELKGRLRNLMIEKGHIEESLTRRARPQLESIERLAGKLRAIEGDVEAANRRADMLDGKAAEARGNAVKLLAMAESCEAEARQERELAKTSEESRDPYNDQLSDLEGEVRDIRKSRAKELTALDRKIDKAERQLGRMVSYHPEAVQGGPDATGTDSGNRD